MEIRKFEYLENEKSFLDEIKSIFHRFWRTTICWKNKNLIKIADTSFRSPFSIYSYFDRDFQILHYRVFKVIKLRKKRQGDAFLRKHHVYILKCWTLLWFVGTFVGSVLRNSQSRNFQIVASKSNINFMFWRLLIALEIIAEAKIVNLYLNALVGSLLNSFLLSLVAGLRILVDTMFPLHSFRFFVFFRWFYLLLFCKSYKFSFLF